MFPVVRFCNRLGAAVVLKVYGIMCSGLIIFSGTKEVNACKYLVIDGFGFGVMSSGVVQSGVSTNGGVVGNCLLMVVDVAPVQS